jgi:D-threonate/D-erythronate kinase
VSRSARGREGVPLSNPYRPTSTCILADDLTGACDAAVAFAARGIPTLVCLQQDIAAVSSGVLALSTATRDVTPALAEATIQTLAQNPSLTQFPHIFKKIDSVFRGNTFVEIAATVRAFPGRIAIIAPASPRHGRTCVNGILRIHDISGRRSTPLRPALETHGLIPHYVTADLAAGIRQAHHQNASAVFCDSTSDHDLAVIVEAAESLQVPILWIGSSGLAHALASTFPQQPLQETPIRPGHVLLLTGSDHPVSRAQLDHLDQQTDLPVTTIPIVRNDTTDEDIRHAVGLVAPQDLSCFVLNGGDTALQVCRALGIESLELHAEFAPGIPQAIARGGRFDGTTVILKSGGFGASDLFSQIVSEAKTRHAQQELPA